MNTQRAHQKARLGYLVLLSALVLLCSVHYFAAPVPVVAQGRRLDHEAAGVRTSLDDHQDKRGDDFAHAQSKPTNASTPTNAVELNPVSSTHSVTETADETTETCSRAGTTVTKM
ncbi:hypothetical protein AYL99_11995 [Fonsecaea erecta]|uniref:Transmembrane protein n=1 Tax=Fonsecaea erecta TaxID=1367422 RepID=A0A178Z1Y8_9EURO|nr:hypothetical protein AYL99_11995 [Fonsecaea erecta]OAP53809.1 hypothetical protein AYL99_11995 [Fonsecaea erecta]